MSICISNLETRKILETKGFCFVLRGRRRKHIGRCTAIYKSYNIRLPFAKVKVEYVKKVSGPEELKPYLRYSGYKNVFDWWRTGFKHYGGSQPPFYLYKVSLVRRLPSKWILTI